MTLYILLLHLTYTTVTCLDEVSKDLLTPMTEFGEACGYQACPDIKPDYLNVHIVPATHGELGGTRTFQEHYAGDDSQNFIAREITMKNILDSVITSLWADKTRTFTLSDLTYFFYWWKDRDSKVRRMVYELIRQGRLFFVGGGWGMADESTAHYHAIIDLYTYGLRKLNATFLACGRPLVTWQADAFGHSREFASLMAQMGFDGHFINPISFDDELARLKSKSLEFVWRGSDDLGAETDIFTHKLFDGYWSPPGFCFGAGCTDPLIIADNDYNNVAERVQAFLKQVGGYQSPYYTTNNVMVVMGQIMGYHDAKTWYLSMDTLIKAINGRAKNDPELKFNLVYSTPACYLKEVRRAIPTLKTKQDDFLPIAYDKKSYYTAMFYGRPAIKYLAREIHLYLLIAKQLQMFGHIGNHPKKFEEIHWIAGAILDHTIHTGGMKDHVNNYYVTKAHRSKDLCMQMIRQAFNKLRRAPQNTTYFACPLNVSSCWTLSGNKSYIMVYNPLAWPVTIPVRLPVQRVQYKLVDSKGDPIAHSIVTLPEYIHDIPERSTHENLPSLLDELVFIADRIPAMGFRSYFLQKEAPRTKREIIKKMTKNKKRKFLTRQSHSVKASVDNLINQYDDDYYIDVITHKSTIIEFANVSKENENQMKRFDYVLTPRSKNNDTNHPTETSRREGTADPINGVPHRSSTHGPHQPHRTSTTEPVTPIRTPHTQTPYSSTESTKSPTSQTATEIVEAVYYDETTQGLKEEVEGEVSWQQEMALKKLEGVGYHSVTSEDDFIKNEYIKINLVREHNHIISVALSNGVIMRLNIQLMYYVADKKKSNEFIFKPMDTSPDFISRNPNLKVVKSKITEQINMHFAPFAGFTVRLYQELPYIEVEWRIGPIPVEDGFGKEIFIRYSTDLQNNGVFYTDSNGRQTIKRIKDKRFSFPLVNGDGIASNIFPITSKAYIEDTEKNLRFSVFPDRGEGCTSLEEGELDIMLHRRLAADENEDADSITEGTNDNGLIATGKHRLYISKADYKPNKVFEKKFAKELEIHPLILTSGHPYFDEYVNFKNWTELRNEYSALNKRLPIGVHVLSFEKWDRKLMIRLENYLEEADVVRNGLKIVNILTLFNDYLITRCQETLLGTNIWRSDYFKMEWLKGKFVKNFNKAFGNSSRLEYSDDFVRKSDKNDVPAAIRLVPQQIRTFICNYQVIGEVY